MRQQLHGDLLASSASTCSGFGRTLAYISSKLSEIDLHGQLVVVEDKPRVHGAILVRSNRRTRGCSYFLNPIVAGIKYCRRLKQINGFANTLDARLIYVFVFD